MERRVKAINISEEDILFAVNCVGLHFQAFKALEFEGIEGAVATQVRWAPEYCCFQILLTRGDWEEVPMGSIVPVIEKTCRVFQLKDLIPMHK